MRLHRIFLSAGTDVLGEIAQFIKKAKGKTPLVMEFVRRNAGAIRKRPPNAAAIRVQGKYHNLSDIFRSLNNEYFGGRLDCPITWGARNLRYSARKRTLGSYSRETNTIRISPLLDRRTIPSYFLEFVVYHEMLHSDVDPVSRNGKRLVHTGDFRRRERLFRHYKKAMERERRGI